MPPERPAVTVFLACVRDGAEARTALDAGFDGVVGPPLAGFVPPVGTLVGHIEEGGPGDPALVFAAGPRLIVVKDRCPDEAELAALGATAAGLLVTATDRLVGTLTMPALASLAAATRRHGLMLALAGGLEPPDVPRLLALQPTMLLFGRVLREGGALDARRLRAIVALKAAGAGASGPAVQSGVRLDRIFVRDLVVEMAIGAYASERGRTQRVGFSVEADVRPPALGGGDLRAGDLDAVVSYDLITDAVHRLTTGRHVDLVETLAEEIAACLLAVPRIAVVRVEVAKLDLGPGAVGVKIERGGA